MLNADTIGVVTSSLDDLTDKHLVAYCDNNPIVRRDSSGYIWETVLDIVSLAASLGEVVKSPTDSWAWAGLAGDTIDLLPFVTGVGEATRAVKIINKADGLKPRKLIDKDTVKWLNKGSKDYTVYYGIENGNAVYTGITKQELKKRRYQHKAAGKPFDDLEPVYTGLTRNQARALEQYYIINGPNKHNGINSISPKRKIYKGSQVWAKKYIRTRR